MPERRKHLSAKLSELDEHLESGEPIDSAIKEPLKAAIGNVQQAIDAPAPEQEEHGELTEALGDLALNFEVSHPKLTEILNHISEILAGAGI